MASSRFVYLTYIRTTPAKLWQALIDPEFTRRYWCETRQESEWKPGASWRSMIPDGRIGDSGEILEISVQQAEKRAKGLFITAVRRGGNKDNMAVRGFGNLLDEFVTELATGAFGTRRRTSVGFVNNYKLGAF